MRKINKIIIHCSATPEGKDYTVQQIRQWHTTPKPKGNGWRDIGYHFVIYRDGSIHKGRPIEQIGAHTSGYNANSIGICYIGGCAADGKTPKDTRTEAQKAALIALCKELKASYPLATIHGHNEFANKACPSFIVKNDSELCAI
ncbi:MAG: N-acetylmuramoyl-L-alanine amidase [Muribaculaceae bacterium]|nr:N-acetylmuramoyl-L-alanine amidase [Muribaculaceae bacterium]